MSASIASSGSGAGTTTTTTTTTPTVLNHAEIQVKQYQFLIGEAKGDIVSTIDLVDEMYLTGAQDIALVRNIKGSGCKRYMQRAYRVARCLHHCYRGDKVAFAHQVSQASSGEKLILPNYNCPYGHDHHKIKGAAEQLVHLPPGGIPVSKPALHAAVQGLAPKEYRKYTNLC